jgi:hypothetical protein
VSRCRQLLAIDLACWQLRPALRKELLRGHRLFDLLKHFLDSALVLLHQGGRGEAFARGGKNLRTIHLVVAVVAIGGHSPRG